MGASWVAELQLMGGQRQRLASSEVNTWPFSTLRPPGHLPSVLPLLLVPLFLMLQEVSWLGRGEEWDSGPPESCPGGSRAGLHSGHGGVNGAGEVTSGAFVHRWSLLCTCGFAHWQFQRHTIL